MRFLSTILLFIAPVFAAELKIDHVTIAGQHLDVMRRAFTAATGFPTEYGGPHANRVTEMALVSFPGGTYIELISIQRVADPAAVAAHEWTKFMNGNAGPCAFAVNTNDISGLAVQLRAGGVQVKTPEHSGRARPDGTRLEWETTAVGPGPRGSMFPFLIRDITPRERRVYPSGTPTTDKARGVSKVVIGVSDLEDAITQYRGAFQLGAPKRQRDPEFGAELAWFEGTPFVLAQGLESDSWLSRRVREYGNLPCAIVLSVTGGMMGARASRWYDRAIFWTDQQKLGWRLGMELPQ